MRVKSCLTWLFIFILALPPCESRAGERDLEEFNQAKIEIERLADQSSPLLTEIQKATPTKGSQFKSAQIIGQDLGSKAKTLASNYKGSDSLTRSRIGKGVLGGVLIGAGIPLLSYSVWAPYHWVMAGEPLAAVGSFVIGGMFAFPGLFFGAGFGGVGGSGYDMAAQYLARPGMRKKLQAAYIARLRKNGVVLPDKDPEVYLQHLVEGGLTQAYTLTSRKRTWTEIERLEKALGSLEEFLRSKGRTEFTDEIALLRKELRTQPSRFDSKKKLFEFTQDVRRRYSELNDRFEIHGTKGLPPIEAVLYPEPQRVLSEISLDLAVVQPRNPKSKADVAAARELYAQYLSSELSEILGPARAEGAHITVDHDPKSGLAHLTIQRAGDAASTEISVVEKDLARLPERLHSQMRDIPAIRTWAIESHPGCGKDRLKAELASAAPQAMR